MSDESCPHCHAEWPRWKVKQEWRDWDVMARRVWCCRCGFMAENWTTDLRSGRRVDVAAGGIESSGETG